MTRSFSRSRVALPVGIAIAALALAQPPFVLYRSVQNAYSLSPAGLPAGPIARGSMFTMSGANIGPADNSLGNISITITQGATTVSAAPLTASPTQVTAMMPMNAPLGAASLRLTYDNAKSNPVPIQIVATQFGIATANGFGNGPAVAQIVNDDGSLTGITLQSPAMPQQIVSLTGTGLGGVNLSAISVFVGGAQATVSQAGPVDGSPGQEQVQFAIPDSAPPGCWVPVYVKTGPAAVSNFATLAISPDGSGCQEPNNVLASALINGGNTANYAAARLTVRHDAGVVKPIDAISEFLGGYTVNEQAGPNNFNPLFSLPPAGSCTVYAVTGELRSDLSAIVPGVTPPTGMALDAGAAQIVARQGMATANPSPDYPGMSAIQAGAAVPSLNTLHNQTILDSGGGVTLNVPGGADLGSTSADSTAPLPFTWTNRDQILAVARSKALTLTWSGGDPAATTFLVGYGFDMPTNSGAIFLCTAPPGATSFAIPPDVLSSLPVSRARASQTRSVIFLGQWNLTSPTPVSADGIDFGSFVPVFVAGKTVVFQ